MDSGQVDTHIDRLQTGDIIAIEQDPFKGKKGIVQVVSKNSLKLLVLDMGVKITLTKQTVA